MLKEFRVENFKSISEEQVFTMEACKQSEVSEHPEHVVEIGGHRILKVSSFYGPNGSGKTNLLSAIITMFNVISSKPITLVDGNSESNYPCLFCDNIKKNSKFTVFLLTKNYEIGYSIEADLSNVKMVPQSIGKISYMIDVNIVHEEMSFRTISKNDSEFEHLYSRDENGIVKSEKLNFLDLVSAGTPLSKNNSFINYLVGAFGFEAKQNYLAPIFEFGMDLAKTVVFRSGLKVYFYTQEHVSLLQPVLSKTTELLNKLDVRISGLKFKQDNFGRYYLVVERTTESGKKFFINVDAESSGTRKLINTIFDVLVSKDTSIFLADDLDAHFHPKLIRALIELFTSDDNKEKQLIFNSHDITNMNNHVFRRDEIWFAYRNNETYSTTYMPLSSIVDYKGNMIRKDAVYGKQYLEGKYGSDPFIEKGLSWK